MTPPAHARLVWPLLAMLAGAAVALYFGHRERAVQGDPRRVRGRGARRPRTRNAAPGVASVAATVLAVILGIELGFTAVAGIAVAICGLGGLSLRSLLPADPA